MQVYQVYSACLPDNLLGTVTWSDFTSTQMCIMAIIVAVMMMLWKSSGSSKYLPNLRVEEEWVDAMRGSVY